MALRNYHYLMILAMLLWGGGWSALKILTYELPMEVILFWRFFLMTLTFIPIFFILKKPLRLNKKNTPYILGSSVLNVAFMVFAFYGVKYGGAGEGGVIITTLSPVMTFLLVALLLRKHANNMQYLGLFVGVIGGAVMLQLNNLDLFFNGANLYYLACALIWAGVTLLSQYSHQHIHPIHYSFVISIIATIATYFFAWGDDLGSVFEQSSEFWIALIYLAVLAQSVATTIFFMASGVLGSEQSSSYMFLVPVFALLIASTLLEESMESHIVIGGLISLISVYLINKTKKS